MSVAKSRRLCSSLAVGLSAVLEPVKLFAFSFQGDFNERCAQCSEVNWGLTDGGRFYCRTCHNVIEVKS